MGQKIKFNSVSTSIKCLKSAPEKKGSNIFSAHSVSVGGKSDLS